MLCDLPVGGVKKIYHFRYGQKLYLWLRRKRQLDQGYAWDYVY